METIGINETLEVTGRSITTFIAYHAALRLGDMAEGDILELVTDNYEPIARDIPAWCAAIGHIVVRVEDEDATLRFHIAKGVGAPRTTKHVAMVIGVASLEELLSPLGFALAAALEGDDVSIYFQGPAVRVLGSGYKANLGGWARRPFSVFARRGMAAAGHSEPQVKLRQLRELGANFYACGPSMDHFNVPVETLAFSDVPIVEYLTFMSVMRAAEVQLFVQ